MNFEPQFEIFTMQKVEHPTVFVIDNLNFQQMLNLRFSEISQYFSSFRQPFFIVSKGELKEKTQKPMYSFGNFSAISISDYKTLVS